jgi:hypothetical protein
MSVRGFLVGYVVAVAAVYTVVRIFPKFGL